MNKYLDLLKYNQSNSFDLSNKQDIVSLVVWLEDRVIRELEIDERLPLRQLSELWDYEFINYLNKLASPYEWTVDSDYNCILWLLSHAIGISYEETAQELSNMEIEDDNHVNSDKIIYSEDEIRQCNDIINNISTKLGIIIDNDLTIADKIQKIINKTRFQFVQVDENVNNSLLDDYPSGLNISDPVVNKCVIILKMLHTADFRDLQNDLNNLLVLGQEYTANPKTNSSLGKVGS